MDSQAQQMLDLLTRDRTIGAVDEVVSGKTKIQVVDKLIGLAHAWPSIGGNTQRGVLDPLCRKIAIARRVWSEYDSTWKKPRKVKPLPDSDWPLLIGVLLAYASPVGEGSEQTRGAELKNLNAALQAIDIVEDRVEDVYIAELKNWADRIILDQIG